MKISKRLKLIASLVDKKANVIDVGCDHALLDIFLTLNNENKCLASDININALNIAKENIKKYHLSDQIDTIISDGLKNINIELPSTVIISGMGTSTIVDIMKQTNIDNIDSLIIQSNNDLKLLRKEIIKLGFYIDDEEVINDKKIYYVIIKFKKGRKKYNNNNDYIIGPILKNKEQSKEYYQYLLDVNNKIIKHLPRKYIKQRYILKKVNKLYKNYL